VGVGCWLVPGVWGDHGVLGCGVVGGGCWGWQPGEGLGGGLFSFLVVVVAVVELFFEEVLFFCLWVFCLCVEVWGGVFCGGGCFLGWGGVVGFGVSFVDLLVLMCFCVLGCFFWVGLRCGWFCFVCGGGARWWAPCGFGFVGGVPAKWGGGCLVRKPPSRREGGPPKISPSQHDAMSKKKGEKDLEGGHRLNYAGGAKQKGEKRGDWRGGEKPPKGEQNERLVVPEGRREFTGRAKGVLREVKIPPSLTVWGMGLRTNQRGLGGENTLKSAAIAVMELRKRKRRAFWKGKYWRGKRTN